MNRGKLKCGEIALMLAVAVTLLWGIWASSQQTELAGKMIRLHVIANSDTPEDQQLKLSVRDEILARATEILAQADDMADAQLELAAALPQLEQEARDVMMSKGYHYAVSARLEETEFPRKLYEGFALPGGKYLALRVIIGEGAGENWWCVVFPPLCTTAATDWEQTAICTGLDEEDLSLITQENPGYVLKFRSLELWESFRRWLGKE